MTGTTTPLEGLTSTVDYGDLKHLPLWPDVRQDRVVDGVRAAIERADAAFAALEADAESALEASWDGLMLPLERIERALAEPVARIAHLLSVDFSDALNDAYEVVRGDHVVLATRMAQSRPLYDALGRLAQQASLNDTQRRIVDENRKAMEHSGVHLDAIARAKFLEIQERLSELGQQFAKNLTLAQRNGRVYVTDASELDGVPEPVVNAAAALAEADGKTGPGDGPWHFQVTGTNYQAILENAQHRGLRERMYRAFAAQGTEADTDNRDVVVEILQLRQAKADLLGFEHYAALSLNDKMAGAPAAVWKLIDQLENAARPPAERELRELEAFVAEAGDTLADGLQPWDVAFYSERMKSARFGFDAERVRDYFQVEHVLGKLFELMRELYDLEFKAVPSGDVPGWDPAVTFYEVAERGQTIAGFYMDLYERPGRKRPGAWMNSVVDRSRVLAADGATSSLPIALFVMNARPPAAGRPATFSLDEVRTLFHEFGHALQHMLTRVHEGGASGMNLVEWDTVELPSQFNENWIYQPGFLKDVSAHVDDGTRLEDEVVSNILASRNFMAANATLRQLQFAKADMRIHEECGHDAASPSPFDVEAQVVDETVVTPTVSGYPKLPAFGHLFAGGYAAGYYSYKWAEVMAADAFAAFEEAGLDDTDALRDVARRFRETVLADGGSRPSAETYRAFRGRDATIDALLRSQGLAA